MEEVCLDLFLLEASFGPRACRVRTPGGLYSPRRYRELRELNDELKLRYPESLQSRPGERRGERRTPEEDDRDAVGEPFDTSDGRDTNAIGGVWDQKRTGRTLKLLDSNQNQVAPPNSRFSGLPSN